MQLNINKTKELVVDLHEKQRELLLLVINNHVIKRVDHFRFLGTTIFSSLKWEDNITTTQRKAHQRLFL